MIRASTSRAARLRPAAKARKTRKSPASAQGTGADHEDFDVWQDDQHDQPSDRHDARAEASYGAGAGLQRRLPFAAQRKRLKGDEMTSLLHPAQGLQNYDLDFLATPTLILPSSLHRTPSLDHLYVPVQRLKDDRLVDAAGHTYLLGPVAAQTELSTGRIVVSFETGRPTVGWAKQIALNSDGAIPPAVREEVAMLHRAKSPLVPRSVLFGDGFAHLLMPNMSGDGLSLLGALATLSSSQADGAAKSLQVIYGVAEHMLGELEQLHAQNIFHRDIKPKNLMYGADSTITIGDFGSAHIGDSPGAQVQSTYLYMLPSHFDSALQAGQSAAKADVYAAGTTLFVLITEQEPLLAETITACVDKEGLIGKDKAATLFAGLDQYGVAWQRMQQYVSNPGASNLPTLPKRRWTQAFRQLVARAPELAPLVVAMMAPADELLPTASESLRSLQAIQQGAGRPALSELPDTIQRLSQAATADTTRTARQMVKDMNARLRARSPLFDELELENQPNVSSIAEARAHIEKLASEPPPVIETLPPVAGVKRIRDMRVKVR